jgi:hypothetical protein
MKFDELNAHVPYVVGGKMKSLEMKLGDVTLALPGKHADQTTPVGGDFVVMVTCPQKKWKRHQFSHIDIFQDVEQKRNENTYAKLMGSDSLVLVNELMSEYLAVILGDDPSSHVFTKYDHLTGLSVGPFLRGVQALAVAEHRRYSQYESKFGGRFLPFRFAAGIAEGLWTAADAAEKQTKGRPGVEWLEKDYGTPVLTKELMGS